MKKFRVWRNSFIALNLIAVFFGVWFLMSRQWMAAGALLLCAFVSSGLFFGMWNDMEKKGLQTDMDISRVLGRDAKEALDFGEIGIITYNEEGVVTWASSFFAKHHIELVNRKLTSWIESIRELFDEEVDTITAESGNEVFEIRRRTDSRVLFVRNVTHEEHLEEQLQKHSIVVGILNLDNYDEYQSYENEELLNEINSSLRSAIIAWSRHNGLFLRRLRSDRFLVILDAQILDALRRQNFSILQKIRDEAAKLDVGITLSMVFCQTRDDFSRLDGTLNELLELVQSRGGDQIAIKTDKKQIEFIGGSSEKSTQRSKVRVRVVGSTIQDLMTDSGKVFITGHVNTDYDAMGGALAAASWARALGKEAHIVLKDVPRDAQLQRTMDHYRKALNERYSFITEEEALRMHDPNTDLVIMVDHSNPVISSGKNLLEESSRIVVIDHHRRSDAFPKSPLLSYVESSASSTAELMTELLQSSSHPIPVFEPEATIMYLGMLVDTNRFRTHTSERTFQAAAALRSWNANGTVAEQALQEDYSSYRLRNDLIQQAVVYNDNILIAPLKQPVSRTMLSQISDSLLSFRGCRAAFTIGINEANGNAAISARSDGTINVQKIMEKMNGGGHFAAAALERENTSVEQLNAELRRVLEQEERI